ncbi:hypothetical protein D3C73_1112640 [compost metagenome]
MVRRATVVIQWQQLRTTGAFAAIELHRVQPQYVHAETDGALGEPGFGIEDEALRPLLSLALSLGRVGEVAIDVEVAQVEVDLGAFDKAVFGRGGEGGAGYCEGDQIVGTDCGCHGCEPVVIDFVGSMVLGMY